MIHYRNQITKPGNPYGSQTNRIEMKINSGHKHMMDIELNVHSGFFKFRNQSQIMVRIMLFPPFPQEFSSNFARFPLQCDEANNKYSVAEKEIAFLKVELSKLAKEKDEEQTLKCELINQMDDLKEKEEKHLKVAEQNAQDLKDLKLALVTCTL